MKNIREQFSPLKGNSDLSYLDSGASSLVPDIVLDKVNEYYKHYPVNIHRGLYPMSVKATEEYENARKAVAEFIGAETNEIIFTSGTTNSLNKVSRMLESELRDGGNIVVTAYEHHANLIPWQEVAKRRGLELRIIPITSEYELDLPKAKDLIDDNTRLVAFSSVSNALGTISPVEELIKLAKEVGAYTVIDAAQQIAHQKVDVKELDVDFLAFSGHKMYGPSGIGVLYGKQSLLEKLNPVDFGGDMIEEVKYNSATWAPVPQKFEAGTPNIAGAIGLATAVKFIEEIGFDNIVSHEVALQKEAQEVIEKHGNVIGPKNRLGVLSFEAYGVHPHDMAEILASKGVAIRAGHHCAMPLMSSLALPGTSRISFGIYNDSSDIKKLDEALEKVKEIFKR